MLWRDRVVGSGAVFSIQHAVILTPRIRYRQSRNGISEPLTCAMGISRQLDGLPRPINAPEVNSLVKRQTRPRPEAFTTPPIAKNLSSLVGLIEVSIDSGSRS